MNRLTIIAIAAAVIAAPMLASAGGADTTPATRGCTPDETFENEEVRIWFHGMKGFVKVFDNNFSDGGRDGMYQYKTLAITELTEENDTLAWMNLERAFPHTSECEVVETDEFVNMTIAVTDTVRDRENGGAVGEATVTFVYHFNKTANGAKFDLFVENWPWQGEESELSFDFVVESEGYTIEEAENGLGFRDDDGDSAGYVEWAPNATAKYEDEHNETAIVDSETDNDGSTAYVGLRFTNVTAGYTELEYDPWVGVGDYIIVGGYLIGLAPVENVLPKQIYRIVAMFI